MRLSAAVSALVLLVCAGLASFAWTTRPPKAPATASTGMDTLRAYRCRSAETKTIIIRGVEDNHLPAGDEPNVIRAERRFPDTLTYFAGGSYDQIQADRRFTDSFRAPANTARGLFLIGLKAVANNDTDTITIGDLSTFSPINPVGTRFGSLIARLEHLPGWSRQGDLHLAELSAISLYRGLDGDEGAPGRTLLDLIRSGANEGWVDISVQDDTSVDFIGVALCQEPPRGKGLSLAPMSMEPLPIKGVVALTCSHGGRDQRNCDPYVGDMVCEARLPVACFRPMASAMPRALSRHFARTVWSGGQIAFTSPVAGSSLATIGEVDARCASRFGGEWRAATLHDGTNNMGISGFGDPATLSGRVWVDSIDQPYATCWARR
ncbi:MAG: hypothetical protein Q8J89_16195 [Caulobacter sp.]|nr:hypothetical protein [Caulobacter sp.]